MKECLLVLSVLAAVVRVAFSCRCPCLSQFSYMFRDARPTDFFPLRFGIGQCVCRKIDTSVVTLGITGEPTTEAGVDDEGRRPDELYFSNGCWPFLTPEGTAEVLVSPRYPHPYPKSTYPTNCLVTAPQGSRINITFVEKLEVGRWSCDDGRLQLLNGIYDETEGLVKCGEESTPLSFVTEFDALYLLFVPGELSYAGFRAILKVV